MYLMDSAALRYGDCFGVPMLTPGRYRYAILPAFGQHLAFDYPFEIEVVAAGPGVSQDQVDVRIDLQDGRFAASPPVARVAVGAAVCWMAGADGMPAFAVMASDQSFASDPLTAPSFYSHRFRQEGELRWADRHGSSVSGSFLVTSPDPNDARAYEKWNRQMQSAVMVEIPKLRKTNRSAVIGQAVVFIFDEVAGISITDERVLAIGRQNGTAKPRPDAPEIKAS